MATDPRTVQVWLNFTQAHTALQSCLAAVLRPHGLSLPELEILARLGTSPAGRLKMYDLARMLMVSQSGITRMVERLVRDGMVQRIPSDNDRRVIYAALTSGGKRTLLAAEPLLLKGIESHFARHLTVAEIAALGAILNKVLKGNGMWDDDRCSSGFPSCAPKDRSHRTAIRERSK